MTDYAPPTIADVPILLDVFERIRDGEPEELFDGVARHCAELRQMALKKLTKEHPRYTRRLESRRWEGKLGLVDDFLRATSAGGKRVMEHSYTCLWCKGNVATIGSGSRISAVVYARMVRHTAECALIYLARPEELGW